MPGGAPIRNVIIVHVDLSSLYVFTTHDDFELSIHGLVAAVVVAVGNGEQISNALAINRLLRGYRQTRLRYGKVCSTSSV